MIRTGFPIRLALRELIIGNHEKVHWGAFYGLLGKNYLVGRFDPKFIPYWIINPSINSDNDSTIREIKAGIALGTVPRFV